MVWQQADGYVGSGDVRGARVSPAGAVLDPAGIRIAAHPGGAHQPAVAAGGDRFLVAWHQGDTDTDTDTDVYGARVDRSGSVLDPLPIAIATAPAFQTAPALAFNGTDFLVAWHHEAAGSGIFGARVSPSGSVLDPTAIAIAPTGDSFQGPPSVSALGATFLVAWSDGRAGEQGDLYGARVTPAGANLDPAGRRLAGSSRGRHIGLASDGRTYFATWDDARLGVPHIFGTAINADGAALGPGALVSRAANAQRTSAVASDGTQSLVVWSDNRSGTGFQIFGTRVDPDGRAIDRGGIPISQGLFGQHPAVAFDGTNFVIAWAAGLGIAVVVMSPSGGALGPPVTVPNSPWSYSVFDVDVAATGAGSVVSWSYFGQRTTGVGATRISPDGRTVGDPIPFEDEYNSGPLAVATDGRDFLLTWANSGEVRARFLRAGATEPEPVFVVFVDDLAVGPAIAWNGRQYLVVWSSPGVGEPALIQGTRVSTTGVVLDPEGIDIAPVSTNGDARPTVAANGAFLVAWRESDDRRRSDLRGARVGDDGSLPDGSGFAIATDPTFESDVSLAPGPGTTWTASYTRFVPERHYGSDRVFLRTVSPK